MPDTAAPAATAARAAAGALLRHAFTFTGAWFVRKGYLDQATADSAVGPIAEYVLGAGAAIVAAGWSAFRAQLMHARWVQAWIAPAQPLPSTTSGPG